MVGGGFGFAIVPVLRWIHRDDPERLVEATGRHVGHFNAHPYLVGLAVGAVASLEAEGASPDEVTRFKSAVRGPLGGLGDRLVWAGWLPATVLVGIVLSVVGAPPGVVVVTFLALYNAGHLGLRAWAFKSGLEAGTQVARRIHAADLTRRTERVQLSATVLLGALSGLLAARILEAGIGGSWFAILGAVALTVGARLGHRIWRPMAAGLIAITVVLAIAGALT